MAKQQHNYPMDTNANERLAEIAQTTKDHGDSSSHLRQETETPGAQSLSQSSAPMGKNQEEDIEDEEDLYS